MKKFLLCLLAIPILFFAGCDSSNIVRYNDVFAIKVIGVQEYYQANISNVYYDKTTDRIYFEYSTNEYINNQLTEVVKKYSFPSSAVRIEFNKTKKE